MKIGTFFFKKNAILRINKNVFVSTTHYKQHIFLVHNSFLSILFMDVASCIFTDLFYG